MGGEQGRDQSHQPGHPNGVRLEYSPFIWVGGSPLEVYQPHLGERDDNKLMVNYAVSHSGSHPG